MRAFKYIFFLTKDYLCLKCKSYNTNYLCRKTQVKIQIQFSILIITFFWFLPSSAQPPIEDKNWQINVSKSDEFNSTILGPKWQKISGDHWGESLFIPSYANLNNGNLELKIDKIGSIYYTGGIETHNFNYLNGYFEIEAVLPYGTGIWPCFWVWGADGPNSYTEIDILEPNGCQYQNANRNVYGFWYKPIANRPCSGAAGSPVYNPDCEAKVEFNTTNISNMSTNTHKYAVEWHPEQVIFYLDDIPVGSAYNDNRIPFDPTKVVIDLQTSGGDCKPDNLSTPQLMKVNYFRYYDMKMDCNSTEVVSSNNFDFSNSSILGVKKSYNITNTIISSGSTTTIRATDFIELGPGFEVPSNTLFNAITTPCY